MQCLPKSPQVTVILPISPLMQTKHSLSGHGQCLCISVVIVVFIYVNGAFLYQDHEQLRSVTEAILIPLVVQCSGHGPRSDFLLFVLRSLCGIGCINWDTFLPALVSSVSSAEIPVGQTSQAVSTVTSSSLSQSGMLPPPSTIANSSNFQSSNPASPLTSVHTIGSPAQSSIEPLSCAALSPVKSSDTSSAGQQSKQRGSPSVRNNDISYSSLRQLCCKIILTGLEFSLKPMTYAEIFNHMLNWLVNWDQGQQGVDESDNQKSWRPDNALVAWLHSCLDVIWLLVDEGKCRVPFYELLRSDLQFMENIPDDEALFTLILEIHRRRDMMAMHMQMLDQHLHCPTFGTHRILNQTTPTISGEGIAHLRLSPISYLSVLGEPLNGEVKNLISISRNSILMNETVLECLDTIIFFSKLDIYNTLFHVLLKMQNNDRLKINTTCTKILL